MKKDVISLKANVVGAIRQEMTKTGAIESYYNKITGGTGACENVPTAFVLADLPEIKFLSQTDQLQMESEILESGLSAVWTLGRSYRKEERAGDGRHLSEFALMEYEAKDMDLLELTKYQQSLLNISIKVALESSAVGTGHKKRLKKYLEKPAKVISYTEVLERLNEGGVSVNWGDDFSSTIEEMVCLIYDGPVQVTHYPESIKFFNMYRTNREKLKKGMTIDEYNEHKWTVDCCDFLLPFGGESFGASRREENYETLVTKLVESRMFEQMVEIRNKYEGHKYKNEEELHDAALKPFKCYLELFNPEKHPERKSVTRSGFGLGMGRLLQFLLGRSTIVIF